MPRKLKNKTFTITENQIAWLKAESDRTGLNMVEIVRRALDAYAQAEESREQRRMFTTQQRRDIKIMARQQGMSEVEVVRQIVNAGLIRMGEKPIKIGG